MNRIVAWGSYDGTKPRVRLLLDALRARDALAAEINMPVWTAIRDKAVAGRGTLLKAAFTLLASYPAAMVRLLRQPSRSAVLLPYPAIPDIFFAWPIARLRRHVIIFDAFISLHDTIVADRRLVKAGGLAAKALWSAERLALRMADVILVDTDQHGDFFASEFAIPRDRFQTVLVGAEPLFWQRRTDANGVPAASGDPVILFYGQLIPLHGLDAILDAIRLTKDEAVQWLVIGTGQEEKKLRTFLATHQGTKLRWTPWVPYEQLPGVIASAAIGLGIFGTSDKAGRVIPNKLFQLLAAGKPVITRASPAVDPVARRYPNCITTVAAGDGAALANAIQSVLSDTSRSQAVPAEDERDLGPASGVASLLARLGFAGSAAAPRR